MHLRINDNSNNDITDTNDGISKDKMNTRHNKKTRRVQPIKNKMTNFKVMYLNIRGIKSKMSSFQSKIEETTPTIMCITETHVLESEEVKLEGYEIYRNDRDDKGGGGTLIAVREEIKNICTVVEKRNDVGDVGCGWLLTIIISK